MIVNRNGQRWVDLEYQKKMYSVTLDEWIDIALSTRTYGQLRSMFFWKARTHAMMDSPSTKKETP